MGGPNDKSNAGQGSGSSGPAGGQSSGGNYGGGNNNNNNNNNNSNNGSTARERYIATQYNKTKTKTKGATNGGSNSNNNNNTSNTNKNNKTDTKDKRKYTSQVTRGPYGKYTVDDIDVNSILNPSEISVAGEGGYKISKDIYSPTGTVVGNVYSTKAYLQGDVNLQGDVDKSFNIDFSNQKGFDATASYDLDNSILSGNVSKYTDIGNTGYKVGVGVDYNDGDIGPSFQIKKSFKRGGLLDKKRG
jgi:hypothetical protein